MLFRSIIYVEKFPETANGKLDRKALPDPTVSDLCEHQATVEENINVEGGNDNRDVDSDDDNGNGDKSKSHEKSSKSVLKDMSNGGITSRTIDSNRSISTIAPYRNAEYKKAKLAMANHICDIVEKVKIWKF